MTLTAAEIEYLGSQGIGRLATIQPDGSPTVKPVGCRYNAELGTIDIGGFAMSASQKFRNVHRNGQVALVFDDIASRDPWRARFLEIRGIAEAIPADGDAGDVDTALIRIRPVRVLSFGVEEPPGEPRETTLTARTLT